MTDVTPLYACPHCGRSATLPVTRCPACRRVGRYLPASPLVPPLAKDAKRAKSPNQRMLAGQARQRAGMFDLRARYGVFDPRFGYDAPRMYPADEREERPSPKEPEPDPMSPDVHLAYGLALPSSVATETVSFYGVKGSGKTFSMCKFVEELLRIRVPVVVLDPVSAMWGLAKTPQSTPTGIAMRIVGGDHSDEALDPQSGAHWAVVANELTTGGLLFDLGDMRKDDQIVWVTTFLRDLYFLRNTKREAFHLVVDEADTFAPQTNSSDLQNASRDAIEDVVRKGRSRGLGSSFATQRPSLLHKNVASQSTMLVTGQLTSPHDREAVDTWVAGADPDKRMDVADTLATLPKGHAWLYLPGWHNTLRQVRIRPRVTTDSSFTPKVVGLGESRGSLTGETVHRRGRPFAADAGDPGATLDMDDLDDEGDDDGDEFDLLDDEDDDEEDDDA